MGCKPPLGSAKLSSRSLAMAQDNPYLFEERPDLWIDLFSSPIPGDFDGSTSAR